MKHVYTLILATCLTFITNAQAPQGINYQGVARNAAGVELSNQSIGIELSVLEGSPSGTTIYTETHALTTDANGLFTLVIGAGTPTTGTFNAINWAVGGSKFLKVSMDITGGTSYQLMGTSQMLSVPYALCAGNVVNNGGKQTLVLSDDVTNAQAATIIANEVGPNTQEIKIVGTTNLTTVDLSMITTAIYIEVSNNSALATLNLSGLTRCDGSVIFNNNPALTSLDISSLAKITTGEFVVSNVGLTSLNLPALVKCNTFTTIDENTALVSISMPSVTNSINLHIEDNSVLTSISFGAMSTINDTYSISGNPDLNTVSFPALASCGSLSFSSNSDVTSLTFPSLGNAGSVFVSNCASISTMSFPALITTGGINSQNNVALTSLSFPSLTTSGNINMNNNTLLTSVDLSALTSSGSINVISNPALATLSFPALTTTGSSSITIITSGVTTVSFPALTSFGNSFNASGCKLSVASVNALLAKLVSIPALTGKTISLNSQTPMAPPSGQGVTDKATLITNGNTVNTD
ncbi:MAG: hypothetical protein Q8M29_14140 [Bacteroidota bacterium]|nr:hypothetical protein [Bacteroidota bacterium]